LSAAWHRLQPVAALLLGALQTLAFVQTSAWWLPWLLPPLTLGWLVWSLDACRPARAALLAWCFGLGWLLAGVWWLFISLHRYGGLPAWLAAAAVFALAAALSLYLAAAGAAYARWRSGRASDVLLFGAVVLLAELARGVIFTGFPWVALGYSQVDSPLAALAPWIGAYGIGAVLACTAAAWAHALRRPGRARSWVAAALLSGGILVLAVSGPGRFTEPVGELQVALLQTNVQQDQKFSAEHLPQQLAWVGRELLAARADLVVAPETAVPLLPFQLEEVAPGYWQQLQSHFAAPGRAALVGVPLGDFESGYTNSVVGLTEQTLVQTPARPYRYDKLHLVPFGEFIPTGFRWFTELMNIPLGDFARGVRNPPSLALGAQRLAPNICYEDLFGEEIARRFVVPALAPTVLVNVSNIGWFGQSIAIDQHLHISRFRTLEFQLPMLRATNTGATAIIDHQGRVKALLPPHTRGVLTGQVQGRQGVTPFAWWAGRLDLWPLWLLGLGVVVGLAWRQKPDAQGVGRKPGP